MSNKIYRTVVFTVLEKANIGNLLLIEAYCSPPVETRFGSTASSDEAVLIVHDPSFFAAVAKDADIGLGESYMRKEWSSPNTPDVLLFMTRNMESLATLAFGYLGLLGKMGKWIINNRINQRTDGGKDKSISGMSTAYDVGNDFFRYMLGPSMQYTCAVFRSSDNTLGEAQRAKIDLLIRKADIHPGQVVLDIGCGWGGLLHEIHRRTGAQIHGISLAREQVSYCQENIPEGEFHYMDYRDLQGTQQYDRVISVGMMEHVGKERMAEFMEIVSRMLKPGGRAVLHTMITGHAQPDIFNNQRMDSFFQKYLMPTGVIPDPATVICAAINTNQLTLVHEERLGAHYARTFLEWRKNLLSHSQEIAARYSGEHVAMYDYSWSLASSLFRSSVNDLLQIILEKRPIAHQSSTYFSACQGDA